MRTQLGCIAVLTFAAVAAPAWAQGGLTVDADQVPWPRLQARIGLAVTPTSLLTDFTLPGYGTGLQGGRVLGDYYFLGSGLSLGSDRINGGFRATSGLLLGPHGTSLSMPSVPQPGLVVSATHQPVPAGLSLPDAGLSDSSRTVPYLGVGYTGLAVKGGWGFTADLGLMALNPGSTLNLTHQGLDDTLRDMRLTPVLQLGVSFSF